MSFSKKKTKNEKQQKQGNYFCSRNVLEWCDLTTVSLQVSQIDRHGHQFSFKLNLWSPYSLFTESDKMYVGMYVQLENWKFRTFRHFILFHTWSSNTIFCIWYSVHADETAILFSDNEKILTVVQRAVLGQIQSV